MVLNVTDEVINGTPKYNITPNGDGTNSIELANEVVSEGTAINKALFDKIENVLSYQIPSVEQRSTHEDYVGDIFPSSIEQNWTQNQSIGGHITLNYDMQGGIKPTMTWYAPPSYPTFYSAYNPSGSSTGLQSKNYSTIKYDSSTFLANSKRYYSYDYNNSAGRKDTYIILDMGEICIPTIIYYNDSSNKNVRITASNDNINWIEIGHLNSSSQTNITIRTDIPYRYYKFTDISYGIMVNSLYISKIEFAKSNIFTLGNETTFSNNERILLNTSSSVITTGVGKNTFNGVDIDSILEASKYYELVYNEAQNKFIAQEVLN